MLRWMFFEQYNHEPNVATLRFWLAIIGEDRLTEAQRGQVASKRAAGTAAALALMDAHLADRDWFIPGGPSLADIALYAYTHVSGEGGFRLADYPAIERWLGRIAALPEYIAMA